MKIRRTMIVTAQVVQLARQLAAALPSGLGMFVAAYSADGSAPATHYVSDGWIEEEFVAGLESPESLVAMVEAAGQTLPLAMAQALLANATLDERDASEALSELGLVPVVEGAV